MDLLEYEFNFILDEDGYKQAIKETHEVTKKIKKNKAIKNLSLIHI